MDTIHNYIEYSLLSPVVNGSDVDSFVRFALDKGVKSICVPPFWVKRASRELGAGDLTLTTQVGTPFGYQMTETKLTEINCALSNGVDEIDIMFNTSAFLSGMTWPKIELAKASKQAHEKDVFLKVLLDMSLFDVKQAIEISKMAKDAGADYVHFLFPEHNFHDVKSLVSDYMNAGIHGIGIQVSASSVTEECVQDIVNIGAERVTLNYFVK